ncbi:hypothetical protein [Streptomyces sp. NPDC005731]|uniref:hypothetical protein n=1 Tax=Streptomyces sp. NPDC005731 TaxID=3157056 RepID=UPI00341161CB
MRPLGRLGWGKLATVQQWTCEQLLGMTPAGEDEKPPPRRTQADQWAMNYDAAKQYYQREDTFGYRGSTSNG